MPCCWSELAQWVLLCWAQFDVLTDMIVFMLLLFNGLGVAAVYVLRRTLPDAVRPYRVWGYPVVPALFLVGTVYLMINTLIATPGRALAGLGSSPSAFHFMLTMRGACHSVALRIGSLQGRRPRRLKAPNRE